MSNKNKYLFPISLLIFTSAEVFLLKNNQFLIGILFYLFYIIFLFFVNKNYIISFFVFSLPLLPIIPTEYKLFSLIGPHEIIYGGSFIVLLRLSKQNRIKKLSYQTKINKYQKLSINFIYFLFFLNIYIITKDIFFGINLDKSQGTFYIFKILVRLFLYYYSMILLIKNIYTQGAFGYIIEGMKFSALALVISMIYSKQLILLGADIQKKEIFMTNLGSNTRFVGFWAAGDENSAGIFLVSIFAFLLAMFEKTGKIKEYAIYFAFVFFGILLTGSRTSFIALVLVVLIFLITNKSHTSRFTLLIVSIIFYFTFSKQLDVVVQRFLDPSAIAAIDPNEKGRVGKWIFYTDWILNNPETLLFGNQTKINYNRAPHNYFIYIVYHAGIIPLLIFINLFIQLIKKIKISIKPTTLKNVYFIIPFLLVVMVVNTFGSSIYLWFFLPIGAMFLKTNNESKY